MRISVVLGNQPDQPVAIYRPGDDPHSPYFGDRRHWLVISAPYRMPAAAVLLAIEEQLDDEELVEVAEILGLHEA